MNTKRTLLAFTVLLQMSLAAATASEPNIILIFADDLGYGDLGCYGAAVKTPTLDRLASEGFRSTDCLVAANVCGPSRAALMTGRYPMRCGHPISRHPLPKYSKYGIAPEEQTMAELLKSAGYHTRMVGKWHLGFHVEGCHPLDAGFDEYLGLHGNNIWDSTGITSATSLGWTSARSTGTGRPKQRISRSPR